jgi:arsenate reductase
MRESGVDLAGARPRRLTAELAENATLLVTMGCGDECPVMPRLEVADWPLPDPKDRPAAEVRTIRDDIRSRVLTLVKSRGWDRR